MSIRVDVSLAQAVRVIDALSPQVSSSKVLDTGDAHPVFVISAAALIKTGELCNRGTRPVMWAARKVHRGGELASRASAAVVSVGARGMRHSAFAAGKTVKGSMIVARNAVKGSLLVSRHAVLAASCATLAVGRGSARMAGLAVRAGITKARRVCVGTAKRIVRFSTQVALPAVVGAAARSTALVLRVATTSALTVASSCACAAWNARQLSATAMQAVAASSRRVLIFAHNGWCVLGAVGDGVLRTADGKMPCDYL